MSKPILGLVLGGILGVFDGLSALISAPNDPAIKAGIVGIVVGSTFKGRYTSTRSLSRKLSSSAHSLPHTPSLNVARSI